MSWTRSEPPGTAAEPLRRIYERIAAHASRGKVSRIWQTVALDPRGLEAMFGLRAALLDDPAPLTVAQAELIGAGSRSEEHTSELQSQFHLVCRLLLEKKKKKKRGND